MTLVDVNILLYAFREDSPQHEPFRQWLDALIGADGPFAVSELALSAFLRIVTHPRIFDPPTPLDGALQFTESLRSQPNCVLVSPGPRHWSIFAGLCRDAGVKGNLVPDAFLAALAIESGSEWVTTDRDFARFPGLRWRHPLEE